MGREQRPWAQPQVHQEMLSKAVPITGNGGPRLTPHCPTAQMRKRRPESQVTSVRPAPETELPILCSSGHLFCATALGVGAADVTQDFGGVCGCEQFRLRVNRRFWAHVALLCKRVWFCVP